MDSDYQKRYVDIVDAVRHSEKAPTEADFRRALEAAGFDKTIQSEFEQQVEVHLSASRSSRLGLELEEAVAHLRLAAALAPWRTDVVEEAAEILFASSQERLPGPGHPDNPLPLEKRAQRCSEAIELLYSSRNLKDFNAGHRRLQREIEQYRAALELERAANNNPLWSVVVKGGGLIFVIGLLSLAFGQSSTAMRAAAFGAVIMLAGGILFMMERMKKEDSPEV